MQKGTIMTNNEVKETLKTTSRLVNSMDKAHLKDLLKILIDAQCGKDCASFVHIDIRKTVKKLLNDLARTDHVNDCLSRKHMKQIFAIMGDYNVYPVCKLCGQPIKIDTETDQSGQLGFTWDHQIPKSKGGSYDLSNLQPAHKICNNLRGAKPLYSKHYKLKIDINIDVDFEVEGFCDSKSSSPRYNTGGFGLRKQDSWCHKQCRQKQR